MKLICHSLADMIMVIGVLIIIVGIVKTLISYLQHERGHLTAMNNERDLDRLRSNLGAYLLLGLEFGVAADIMITVLEPEYKGLIILGGLVAIRIVIGYFVGKEREDIRHELADPQYDSSTP